MVFENCRIVSGVVAIALLTLAPAKLKAAAKETFGLTTTSKLRSPLRMPDRADGDLPLLLSQTGAFRDVHALKPDDRLIPYDLNVPFWSDGAGKSRWLAVPNPTAVHFSPTGAWKFSPGTAFVKHFDLATDETNPRVTRRLETRLLVCDTNGGVYGVTYKWRDDNSDADLLTTNLSEIIPIKTATGTRTQTWYYPSRSDCLTCHTPLAGGVLGVNTRQMNRAFRYPSGGTENQLRAWNHLGLFLTNPSNADFSALPKLARADDHAASLEARARSYLDANCANCHRPGGTVAEFDARYETPLAQQGLLNAPVLIDEGIDGARVIAPNDRWRSILFQRVSRLDGARMPPLAHSARDERGLALLREWIESLPGPAVVAPPEISPPGGNYNKAVSVVLKTSESGARIHYTLDGSVPGATDPVYEKPIELTGATILRAKSFKAGFTKSITAQGVFNISP